MVAVEGMNMFSLDSRWNIVLCRKELQFWCPAQLSPFPLSLMSNSGRIIPKVWLALCFEFTQFFVNLLQVMWPIIEASIVILLSSREISHFYFIWGEFCPLSISAEAQDYWEEGLSLWMSFYIVDDLQNLCYASVWVVISAGMIVQYYTPMYQCTCHIRYCIAITEYHYTRAQTYESELICDVMLPE